MKLLIRGLVVPLVFLFLPGVSWAQSGKDEIPAQIDASRDRYSEIALAIWGFAEVGYQEERSSDLLQSTLTAAGFNVEAGAAGMPTAFVASYGSNGPVVAILAEFDALPVAEQAAASNPDDPQALALLQEFRSLEEK